VNPSNQRFYWLVGESQNAGVCGPHAAAAAGDEPVRL